MESNAGFKTGELHVVAAGTGGYSSNGVYQFTGLPGYIAPAMVFAYLNGDQALGQIESMQKRGYPFAVMISSLFLCLLSIDELVESLKTPTFDHTWTSVRGIGIGQPWGVCFASEADLAKFMLLYSGPTDVEIV